MPTKRVVKRKITQEKKVLAKKAAKPAKKIKKVVLAGKTPIVNKTQLPESASAPKIFSKSQAPVDITREKIEQFKETKPPALIYPRGAPPAPSHISPVQAGITETGKKIMQVPKGQIIRREKRVFLVGTVHVSKESVRKVEDTIATVLPDMVCLELDLQRFQAMQSEFGMGQIAIKQAAVGPSGESVETRAQTQKTEDPRPQTPLGRGPTSGIQSRGAPPGSPAKKSDDYIPTNGPPSFRELMTLQGLLKWMQQEIGREFGVMPGSEMVSAFKAARKYGIGIGLIDRPVQQTIANMMDRMPFKEKMKLMSYVIAASGMLAIKPLFGGKGIKAMSMLGDGKEIDIGKLERGEGVDGLMEELKKQFPTLYRALVDERNVYMCNNIINILKTRADMLVVVVGMGHMTEIKNILSARGVKVESVV